MMDGATVGLVLPGLFTLALWWLSTGLILYLDGLHPRTFRASMGVVTVLALSALALTGHAADLTGPSAAYLGFACALTLWGWMELSFLTGWITGPVRQAAPPGCAGSAHFVRAIQVVLHHELAIATGALLLWVLTHDTADPVALHAYLLLWVMRISAKLNLHFGVRNLGDALLPPHLHYLRSYFRQRRMNALWPFSMIGCLLLTAHLVDGAARAPAGSAEQVSAALLATLAGLAGLEHLFMMLPVPLDGLWKWGTRSRAAMRRTS
jgi:putative photosynthetic complex assembly protein 2